MTDNEEQDEKMYAGLGVAERDILREKLSEMADTMPPRAVWNRIEEQARAEGLFAPPRTVERLKWLAGAAIAATVAMIALNLGVQPVDTGPVPGYTEPPVLEEGGVRNLAALKVESQLLERSIRLLPNEPAVMKVSTATTIRDIEDRIAAIDFRLNDHTIRLEPAQEEIYWRERVRLLNLLVQLRSAQAQRASF